MINSIKCMLIFVEKEFSYLPLTFIILLAPITYSPNLQICFIICLSLRLALIEWLRYEKNV